MAPSPKLTLFLSILLTATVPLAFGKVTRMRFYLHETVSGPNTTIAIVVNPNNQTGFGTLGVVDDELREGPDPTSNHVGRLQGLAAVSSLDGEAFLATVNMVFTAGEFNGSTIAAIGRFLLSAIDREYSIVGGTGQFRFAQGYAAAKKLTAPDGFLILHFDDVYIVHQ